MWREWQSPHQIKLCEALDFHLQHVPHNLQVARAATSKRGVVCPDTDHNCCMILSFLTTLPWIKIQMNLRVIICAQNLCTDFPFHTFFALDAQFPDLPAQIFIFHTFSCLTCLRKNGSTPRILGAGSTGSHRKFWSWLRAHFFMRASPVFKY